MPTITIPIAVNNDDGFWIPGTQFVNNDLYGGFGNFSGYNLHSFLRFIVPDIPQGATITSAHIEFYASSTITTTTCNATISVVNADSPAAPTSIASADGLSLTGSVAWSNIPSWFAGTVYSTSAIASLVQTIVNRGGWSAGNAMMFVIANNSSSANARRTWASLENVSYPEPDLVITYEVPAAEEQDITGVGNISATVATGSPVLTTEEVIVTTSGISPVIAFGTTDVEALSPDAEILYPSGTESGTTFGTPAITHAPMIRIAQAYLTIPLAVPDTGALAPAGIGSVFAMGSATVQPESVTLSVAEIVPVADTGAATLLPQSVSIIADSTTDNAAIGTPIFSVLQAEIAATGIASTVDFGDLAFETGEISVSPTAINSSSIVSSPTAYLAEQYITLSSIESIANLGEVVTTVDAVTLTISSISPEIEISEPVFTAGLITITSSGIAAVSSISENTDVLPQEIYAEPTGIASEVSFGTAHAENRLQILMVSGLSAQSETGVPQVIIEGTGIYTSGIASLLSFGSSTVSPEPIYLTEIIGIAPVSDISVPTLSVGTVSIEPQSISSQFATGLAYLDSGELILQTEGIQSVADAGTPTVEKRLSILEPEAITSVSTVSTPVFFTGEGQIAPSAIASETTFGQPTVQTTEAPEQNILVAGISSISSIQEPLILTQVVYLSVESIDTQESVSSPDVAIQDILLTPASILPEQAFGQPGLSSGDVTVSVFGIEEQTAFGTLFIGEALHLYPQGISPELEIGSPFVYDIPYQYIYGTVTIRPETRIAIDIKKSVTTHIDIASQLSVIPTVRKRR